MKYNNIYKSVCEKLIFPERIDHNSAVTRKCTCGTECDIPHTVESNGDLGSVDRGILIMRINCLVYVISVALKENKRLSQADSTQKKKKRKKEEN